MREFVNVTLEQDDPHVLSTEDTLSLLDFPVAFYKIWREKQGTVRRGQPRAYQLGMELVKGVHMQLEEFILHFICRRGKIWAKLKPEEARDVMAAAGIVLAAGAAPMENYSEVITECGVPALEDLEAAVAILKHAFTSAGKHSLNKKSVTKMTQVLA